MILTGIPMVIYLETEIACLDKLVSIVNILCPQGAIPVHGNVKPWLHITIEVHNCCIADLIHAYTWIVAKPEDMPCLIEWLCSGIKCDKSRRQRVHFPQGSIFILQQVLISSQAGAQLMIILQQIAPREREK